MNRGEVVEVDWPFSDRTGSKTRPAVVVQADFLNGLIDDTILVQSAGTRLGRPVTEVTIDPTIESAAGLRMFCYVPATEPPTHAHALVLRTIGYLSDDAMKQT